MKTYRINKNAERLAQGTGFAPELIYNISLVRFQGRNGRCIAAWTPGMKRPRYVYKARTPEEYDKAMERIRQEAERFRRHDEAQERAATAFRESLHVGDILYSSWGWEQTNIDFYQVMAIRGCTVDLRQLDQRTTEDGYMCGTTVPLPDVFKGKTHTHRLSKNYIRIDSCRKEIDREIEHLKQERERLNDPHWTEGLLRPVMAEIARLIPEIDWENNDGFYPTDLRGAITVFGRTKRGRPVCITFTESGHDLQFDSGQIHNSFSLKVLKDIGGTNNIMESVGDGEPLLRYIRQRIIFLEQHPEIGK